jgi:phosphoglycerate dehydrogenase-like enzyme
MASSEERGLAGGTGGIVIRMKALLQSPGKKVLAQMMENVTVLGIRSKTRVGPEILQRAPNLSAIGAFCIGTEQLEAIPNTIRVRLVY